jgi:hypothetical protein
VKKQWGTFNKLALCGTVNALRKEAEPKKYFMNVSSIKNVSKAIAYYVRLVAVSAGSRIASL